MADEAILNRVLDHILDLKAGQGEIKKDVGELKGKVDSLENKAGNLENKVNQFRTEVVGHFNRVHLEMNTIFNITSDHEKRIKVLEKTH